MSTGTEHYFRRNLARTHHLGFGFHAEECALGVLRLLEPVLAHSGLVVELGCGSGLLTRHLIDAGHRVVATDASPDMLARVDQPLWPVVPYARRARGLGGEARGGSTRSQTVAKAEATIELAAREFDLLHLLMAHAGEVLRRDRIMDEVWGPHAFGPRRRSTAHLLASKE